MRPDGHGRALNVIGEVGKLAFIADAREMVVVCYANPAIAILHVTVPMMDRVLPAANDPEHGQDHV